MANYFVVNSKFKPYSFDEMLKPYALYGQAYKEQEAALDAAREKEFSADKLDQNLDSVAYNMYNNASNDLRAVSDELATQGLSTGLRGRIKSVARNYKTTMDALNEAQARLYAEQDRRAKMGEDYVYQQNDIRIGDFLNGATPNQKSASLSNVTKNIATQFATRAKAITNDTWDKVIGKNGKVIGGYYDVTTESGLTAAQLDSILNLDDNTWNSIMNDNSISKEQRATLRGFRDAITNEKTAIGFDKYQPDDQDAINNAIAIGATAGLGTTTHKYEADRGYNPLGWAQLKFQKDQAKAAQQDKAFALQLKYPQYIFDENGKVVRDQNGGLKINPNFKASSGSGRSKTDYVFNTPGLIIYDGNNVNNSKTYRDWSDYNKIIGPVRRNKHEGYVETSVKNVKDPTIKRAILSRINWNVPEDNDDVALEYAALLDTGLLDQIHLEIKGNPGDGDYSFALQDKKPQRFIGSTQGMLFGDASAYGEKDLGYSPQ